MKRLLILFSLFYAISLPGQKVYLDENLAAIVNQPDAFYYIETGYYDNPDSFRETIYYVTGEKKSENNYVKASQKQTGSAIWYLGDQSGKFVKQGKSGEWYKNGQVKRELYYLNGKINGKSLEWFENGQLKSQEESVDNARIGKSLKWYENGQLKSESNYTDSRYNGELTTYWRNGVVKRIGVYKEGKYNKGTCYDSLGKEIKHFEFEVMPQYNGGDRQLLQDIADNTVYPTRSRDAGIQGRVVVRFAIDQHGGISDIAILEGVNPELNREAVRVISTLKKFKPGYSDGEAVIVYYMVPITFTLR